MFKLALVTLGFVLVVVGVAIWQAQRRWSETTEQSRQRLTALAALPRSSSYSESDLDDLPRPVARYFRKVLKPGQPIIKSAHVTWRGEFNMGKPGRDKWKPFTANQHFVPGAPGFVWDARIAMAPGVAAYVRDSFVDGTGAMLAKITGLITVADSHGSEVLARAALQRYLGEAVWFPTALLPSQGVKWDSIDDSRARATIVAGKIIASLEFRFAADDLIVTAFAAERIFDDGKNPAIPIPWQAQNLSFGEFHGIKVPMESRAEWLFPEGIYVYWRGRPLTIEYKYVTDSAEPR